MKKLLLLAAVLSLLVSCGGRSSGKITVTANETTEQSAETKFYRLDDLLLAADQLVGQEVTVRGIVTHTCKHSGKRCFIVGDSQNTSFRIEAKGNIGGFNRELTGSELDIKGIVRERRLSQEYLDQMEKDINEKRLVEDGSAEACAAELSNIKGMKAWMKENNKDYYAVYYMDGEDYEIVEE